MTTREQIIAAAKEAGCQILKTPDGEVARYNDNRVTNLLERLYTIAFEAGRQAEREEIVKDLLPPITAPQTKAHYIANEIAEALCKAIRARGEGK